MTNTQKHLGRFIIFLFFVIAVGISFTNTKASEPKPSPADLQNLEDIKSNQKVIEENRPAHEKFELFKGYNEAESAELSKNGWCPVWAENPSDITLAPCKAVGVVHSASYDLDKLADAVAMQETKYCTDPGSPTANARNNCWGIMHWPNGVRTLKTFATKEDGKRDFKRIWSSFYGRLPDYQLAKKYSGNDKAGAWLANVTHYYETL